MNIHLRLREKCGNGSKAKRDNQSKPHFQSLRRLSQLSRIIALWLRMEFYEAQQMAQYWRGGSFVLPWARMRKKAGSVINHIFWILCVLSLDIRRQSKSIGREILSAATIGAFSKMIFIYNALQNSILSKDHIFRHLIACIGCKSKAESSFGAHIVEPVVERMLQAAVLHNSAKSRFVKTVSTKTILLKRGDYNTVSPIILTS